VIYSTGSSFISGYSLSSGRFLSARSSHLYVVGSPRNVGSRGKVSNLKIIYRSSERIYLNNTFAQPLIFISIVNPTRYRNFSNLFYIWNNTLHVGDGFSVHNQ
jgi:hypothetical protein